MVLPFPMQYINFLCLKDWANTIFFGLLFAFCFNVKRSIKLSNFVLKASVPNILRLELFLDQRLYNSIMTWRNYIIYNLIRFFFEVKLNLYEQPKYNHGSFEKNLSFDCSFSVNTRQIEFKASVGNRQIHFTREI